MKNIPLSYILAGLFFSRFWLGVWILFYLIHTNYAGIGIIETSVFLTIFLVEIPTGAIGDMVGRKKTLLLSFALLFTGTILLAFASGLGTLIFAGIVAAIANSFYSGTFDALVYDTLKEQGQQDQFEKKLTNSHMIRMTSTAVAASIGGFLYTISVQLPFLVAAFFALVGFFVCFLLREPSFKKHKLSWRNYLKQNFSGFKTLFYQEQLRSLVAVMLAGGVFLVVVDEVLDYALVAEFGFEPSQMGILFAVAMLISVFALRFLPNLLKKIRPSALIMLGGLATAISLILSPVAGLITGAVLLLIRSIYLAYYDVLTSTVINKHSESSERATTVSTFVMLKNIPYIAGAYYIGVLMDRISAITFAFHLGLLMLLLIVLTWLSHVLSNKEIDIA